MPLPCYRRQLMRLHPQHFGLVASQNHQEREAGFRERLENQVDLKETQQEERIAPCHFKALFKNCLQKQPWEALPGRASPCHL